MSLYLNKVNVICIQKVAEENKKKREAAQKRLKMVSRATVRDDLLDESEEADIPDHHTLNNNSRRVKDPSSEADIPDQHTVKTNSRPEKDVSSKQNYNQAPPVKPSPPPVSHVAPKRTAPAKKKASYQPEVDLDNEGTAFYANVASEAREAPVVDTVPCDLCGRRFAADRLARHSTICAKVSQKKRKVFDPAKMRAKGTDMEPYQRYAQHSAKVNNGYYG